MHVCSICLASLNGQHSLAVPSTQASSPNQNHTDQLEHVQPLYKTAASP
uniref:Rbr3 n=1 Tax=Arundo donax TaxID=35708 RepID=A0A0A9DS72_ARUDO